MSFPLTSKTIRIFYSCITTVPKDKALWKQLYDNVAPGWWEREGWTVQLNYRQDPETGLGEERGGPVSIENAHIIVLLLSPKYLSEERYKREMTRAIERMDTDEVDLILVALYGEMWEYPPLQEREFCPRNYKTLFRRSGDAGIREVSANIRQTVRKLIDTYTDRSLADINPSLYRIPYLPSDFFTDRQEIMQEIRAYLKFEQKEKQTQIITLCGPPGSGKTRIVLEYVYNRLGNYQEILWLEGNSLKSLANDITSSTICSQFHDRDRENEQSRFAAMKRWLQEHENWLVVLDNLRELQWLNNFIPGASHGHVLVTTSNHTTGALSRNISVRPMSRDDNVSLLLRRANIIGHEATSEDASEDDVVQATAIVEEFDSIALALDQAGAYIDETRCGLKQYLDLYHQEGLKLLDKRGHLVSLHKDSVKTTFELSIYEAGRTSSGVRALLSFLSFFPPSEIPRTLISDNILVLKSPPLRELARPLELEQAFGVLLRFSLVLPQPDSRVLSMYQIVQELVREGLMISKRRRWAYLVVRFINHVFPEVRYENWSECQRYFSLALHCAELIKEYQLVEKESASLLERLGYYCYQRAFYEKAEEYLLQALEMYEHGKILDQAGYAMALNSVGVLFHKQGKYQKAEDTYQQALQIRKRLYGPQDRLVAQTLNNLGLVYRDTGRYGEARELYQQVLAIDEQTLEPDHADRATSLNNLASVYKAEGNYSQATQYYQQTFSIDSHTLDSDNPTQALDLNNLAKRYQDQGQYTQAEAAFQRAIVLQERVLGKEHTELADTLHNLAILFVECERYEEAKALSQRALAIYQQAFGPAHQNIALLLRSMGYLAREQGYYQEAENCYQQALAMSKEIQGSRSVVANLLNDLGQLYHLMQQDELAESYMLDELKMREDLFGPEHAECCFSLNTLAAFYLDRHEYEQVVPLYQRILLISQHTSGPAVPDSALVEEQYALLLERIKEQNKSHRSS